MFFDKLIKELDENLNIEKIEEKDNIIYINCLRNNEITCCPFCGEKNSRIHSRYVRTVGDLPIQQHSVKLVINTRKFFCDNPNCKHKTYAERFEFLNDQAVRTKRLDEYISKIGMRNSSMDTVRDLKDNNINVSLWTVLRMLHKKKRN